MGLLEKSNIYKFFKTKKQMGLPMKNNISTFSHFFLNLQLEGVIYYILCWN